LAYRLGGDSGSPSSALPFAWCSPKATPTSTCPSCPRRRAAVRLTAFAGASGNEKDAYFAGWSFRDWSGLVAKHPQVISSLTMGAAQIGVV